MTTETAKHENKNVVKIALIAGLAVSVFILGWFFLMSPSDEAIERDDHRFTIRSSLWRQEWKNMSVVMGQAKLDKIENPDGTISLKMTNIDPKGAFAALGLEEEDLVTSINNNPIYDMQEVLSMMGTINVNQTIELGVKRGEDEEVFVYKIIK